MRNPFSNVLPKELGIRLTVEQLSYVTIAISHYNRFLIKQKEHAVEHNDVLVNITELDRRIKELNKARRAMVESLDE